MGLHPGDVLVAVDGVVVLDDGAALFDALRDRATVTVQILRRGLPSTFEYHVE
jgi:type II secretory pathway component PulC